MLIFLFNELTGSQGFAPDITGLSSSTVLYRCNGLVSQRRFIPAQSITIESPGLIWILIGATEGRLILVSLRN